MQAQSRALWHPTDATLRPCVHMHVASPRCAATIHRLSQRSRPLSLTARAASSEVENEEENAQRVLKEVTRRIKEHGERGRVKAAIDELAGLSKLGIQPDALAATALVRACCKDMELAQGIFQELFGDFLTPDEVTFAVLLRGYGSKTPPDWVKMDSVLSDMRLKHNLEPSAVCYNVLLEVCARTNDLERGEDVVDRMVADGVEPDEYTEACVGNRRSLRSYVRKKLL